MNIVEEFVKDLRILSPGELMKKYDGKLPKDLKVTDVVDEIFRTGEGEGFVEAPREFPDVASNRLTIASTFDGKFEVYTSDRGGKHWRLEFSDLKEAIFCFIERRISLYGVKPPDAEYFKR